MTASIHQLMNAQHLMLAQLTQHNFTALFRDQRCDAFGGDDIMDKHADSKVIVNSDTKNPENISVFGISHCLASVIPAALLFPLNTSCQRKQAQQQTGEQDEEAQRERPFHCVFLVVAELHTCQATEQVGRGHK
jgi:hypothetical protein